MGLNDAPNWTNNFNDDMGDAASTTRYLSAALSGDHNTSDTQLFLSSADTYDDDAKGQKNWNIGDWIRFTGNAKVYEITAVREDTATQKKITITPGISADATKISGTKIFKANGSGGQYQGKHGGAANHLRLRRQGQI